MRITDERMLKRVKMRCETPEEIQRTLHDLLLVGKTKSLGYLSVLRLREACGKTVDEMVSYARENDLKHLLILNESNERYLGHLYFYQEEMLLDILSNEQDVLREAGIPFDCAEAYISHIAHHALREESNPNAYRVIGKTFNDKRFR